MKEGIYYECSCGESYPENADLPNIDTAIIGTNLEKVCPKCLATYEEDKRRWQNHLSHIEPMPPFPMRRVRFKEVITIEKEYLS